MDERLIKAGATRHPLEVVTACGQSWVRKATFSYPGLGELVVYYNPEPEPTQVEEGSFNGEIIAISSENDLTGSYRFPTEILRAIQKAFSDFLSQQYATKRV